MSTLLVSILAAAHIGCGGAPDPTGVLVFWGDSLTMGAGASGASATVPAKVSSLLNGRPFTNEGIGGQSSTQIAARASGIALTGTLTGNSIPASGGVDLTSISSSLLASPIPAVAVSIGGVDGTLAVSGSTYTFTRWAAGASVSVSANTAITISQNDRLLATTIIWVGRNDTLDASGRTVALANVAGMVAALQATSKRYLVLSVLNGAGEGNPSTQYTQITTFNAALASTYGANYLDVRTPLVDGTDTVSATYRSDSIHLNDAGYLIVATTVANRLKALGW